jgi:hypothetical protein
MKVTVDIRDSLHKEIKNQAIVNGASFRSEVEELLRLGIDARAKQKPLKRGPFNLNLAKAKGPLLIDILDKEAMSRLEDEKFYKLYGKL